MTETAPVTHSTSVDRDARSALLVALIVAAVLVLDLLVSFLESFAFGSGSRDFLLGIALPQLLVDIVPKAVGILVVLWLWPARVEDRVVMVLVKALVAAAAACVLAALVGFVYTVVVYGVRFSDAGALPYTPFAGIVSSVVMLAPLVMLVVLAQWVIRRGARL
ncbi:hypothetical protein [Homoserinibacter gongjuensis]|uniref:Uncharacterized protein n=1 Tax=Homoserinibacter gongjuensis TaxID=1162968 RepID=A0ABQ6JMI3_9MICO|nr:hypothetical protein [Homoserinibacter gongjuensis]GMA89501.1 hypothetical protein GCM10025869_00300 [Homoserinibacter gongjuensis]